MLALSEIAHTPINRAQEEVLVKNVGVFRLNATSLAYGVDYFGFVYIWFDRKRRMYYIGSHMGSLNDGYICSSKRMRQAYLRRPETFSDRRVIFLLKNRDRDLLLREEKRWLEMIKDHELGTRYYNLKRNAWGVSTEEIRKQQARIWSDPEYQKRASEIRRRQWADGTRDRAKQTGVMRRASAKAWSDPETRQKMIGVKKNKGMSWYNDGAKNFMVLPEDASPAWKKGKLVFHVVSEETRRRLSRAHKGRELGPRCAEHCRKISEAKTGKKLGPMSSEHRRKISEARQRRS